MTKILLVFHTSEGQTAKIADRVAAVLREDAFDVELHDVAGSPPAPKRSTASSSAIRSMPGAIAARSPATWKSIGTR